MVWLFTFAENTHGVRRHTSQITLIKQLDMAFMLCGSLKHDCNHYFYIGSAVYKQLGV